MGRRKLRIEFENLKYNRHSYYKLRYHLVLVTKYRKKCINKSIANDLKDIFSNIIQINEGELVNYISGDDYTHLSFEVSPIIELPKLVNSLKSASSKAIRRKYKEFLENFYEENYFWSMNYCILTPIEDLNKIIENYLTSDIGVKD